MLWPGRRAVEFSVALFALLGFVSVPLGERTGFEHVKAVLGTPEAARFGAELRVAFVRLRDRLLDEVLGEREPPSPSPRRAGSSAPAPGPRAVPPRLQRGEAVDAGAALPDASLGSS